MQLMESALLQMVMKTDSCVCIDSQFNIYQVHKLCVLNRFIGYTHSYVIMYVSYTYGKGFQDDWIQQGWNSIITPCVYTCGNSNNVWGT